MQESKRKITGTKAHTVTHAHTACVCCVCVLIHTYLSYCNKNSTGRTKFCKEVERLAGREEYLRNDLFCVEWDVKLAECRLID